LKRKRKKEGSLKMNYRLLWRDLHFPSTPICCIADGAAGGFTVSEKPLFSLYHKKGCVKEKISLIYPFGKLLLYPPPLENSFSILPLWKRG
jgi:hypothetical protein